MKDTTTFRDSSGWRRLALAAALPAGALAVLALTVDSTLARPGGPERGSGPAHVRLLGRLATDRALQAEIGLSPSQVSQLQEILKATSGAMALMRAELRSRREELHSVMKDPAAPREEIERRARSLAAAAQSLHEEAFRALLDARDLLSIEQREQLRAKIQQRLLDRRGSAPTERGLGRRGERARGQE